MQFNYNVKPVDFGAYFRGREIRDQRQQREQQQQGQERLQALGKAVMSGDMGALQEIAAINPQYAAQLAQFQQSQRPPENKFDMGLYKQTVNDVKKLIDTGETGLASIAVEQYAQTLPPDAQGEIAQFYSMIQTSPQQASEYLSQIQAGLIEPEKASWKVMETPTGYVAVDENNPENTKDIAVGSKVEAQAAKRAKADLESELKQQKDVFGRAKTLRDRYDRLSAGYTEIEKAYQNMEAALDTGEGDLARVFAYMKILDPGVAVMEGDVVNVRSASGPMQALLGYWNSLQGGGTLTPEVRKKLKEQTDALYIPAKKRNENLRDETLKLGKRYGVKEADIFGVGSDDDINSIAKDKYGVDLSGD